jgi:hypothetical protein
MWQPVHKITCKKLPIYGQFFTGNFMRNFTQKDMGEDPYIELA